MIFLILALTSNAYIRATTIVDSSTVLVKYPPTFSGNDDKV